MRTVQSVYRIKLSTAKPSHYVFTAHSILVKLNGKGCLHIYTLSSYFIMKTLATPLNCTKYITKPLLTYTLIRKNKETPPPVHFDAIP